MAFNGSSWEDWDDNELVDLIGDIVEHSLYLLRINRKLGVFIDKRWLLGELRGHHQILQDISGRDE